MRIKPVWRSSITPLHRERVMRCAELVVLAAALRPIRPLPGRRTARNNAARQGASQTPQNGDPWHRYVRQRAGASVPADDEIAAGLRSGPPGETPPLAKLVRAVVAVGIGDCDRDRADRVMLVGGLAAVEAVAIGLLKTLHVVFEPLVGHFCLLFESLVTAISSVPRCPMWGSSPGPGRRLVQARQSNDRIAAPQAAIPTHTEAGRVVDATRMKGPTVLSWGFAQVRCPQ